MVDITKKNHHGMDEYSLKFCSTVLSEEVGKSVRSGKDGVECD